MIKNRTKIGTRTAWVGILVNLVLAIGKMVSGALFSSTAVTADGLNNLSDGTASAVALLGFKLSEKPADREHPYGHARFEYLAGLTVSALILVIGFELGKTSVIKFFAPVAVEASPPLFAVLVISIAAKLFLLVFYKAGATEIQSKTLTAASIDSRNDVITTAAVLVSILIEHFTKLKIDAVMSAFLSLFILYSGIKMAKETISPLLGEGADPQLREELIALVSQNPSVLGCHDLMVHDYGPGKRYASIHVEINQNLDSMECHEILDAIERECLKRLDLNLVIHCDPVEPDDPELCRLKHLVTTVLKIKDARLEPHDFRSVEKAGVHELFFDITVPENLALKQEEISDTVKKALFELDSKEYVLHITLDPQ